MVVTKKTSGDPQHEGNENINEPHDWQRFTDETFSGKGADTYATDPQNKDIVTISENEFGYKIWLFSLDQDGRPSFKGLYKDGIISKLKSLGYYKRYRGNNSYIFIQERDNIIREVEPCIMKDEFLLVMEMIEFDFEGHRVSVQLEKLRETYLNQHHLIFNDKFLEHLPAHTKPILRDTKEEAFFCFKNKIIKVSKSGLEPLEYSDINNTCIWRTQIVEHEFNYVFANCNCHFGKFITNVCNDESDRMAAFNSAIGYLLHNYSQPSKGQAVIAYDEEITDLKNPMGGTGKGLFANGIKQLRNVAKIDGKKFDPGDKFKYQDIDDSTQVVWLDDVKPELGFETFNSVLTDGWNIEKKYQDQFYIKPEDSPKMIICSNAILNGNGTTHKRRQFIIEFSNHYSKQIKTGNEEPIRQEHGCLFFDSDDWNIQEWDMFFSFMLDCVEDYFKHGLQIYEYKGLNKNKLIQSTSEEFCMWAEAQNFEVGQQYNTKEKFDDFKNAYYGADSEFKQRGFTNWLKKYAESIGCKFVAKSTNSIQYFIFQGLSG